MPLGLGILPLQGALAAPTVLGLHGEDHVPLLDRHHPPRLSLVARLPARPTPGRLAPRPFGQGLRRITRRRARRGARVLLPLLPQLLDCGLQRRDSGVEGMESGLHLRGCALPELWGEQELAVHEPALYATLRQPGKPFSPGPRERFPLAKQLLIFVIIARYYPLW